MKKIACLTIFVSILFTFIAQAQQRAPGGRQSNQPAQPTQPQPPDSPNILRQKIDFANHPTKAGATVKMANGATLGVYGSEVIDRDTVLVALTPEEKDAVIKYLQLAERTLKKKPSEATLRGMLEKLGEYKTRGKRTGNNELTKYPKITVYVACLAGIEQMRPSSSQERQMRDSLVSLLPECNRLSGNAHNNDEENRLKSIAAQKKLQQQRQEDAARRQELFGTTPNGVRGLGR